MVLKRKETSVSKQSMLCDSKKFKLIWTLTFCHRMKYELVELEVSTETCPISAWLFSFFFHTNLKFTKVSQQQYLKNTGNNYTAKKNQKIESTGKLFGMFFCSLIGQCIMKWVCFKQPQVLVFCFMGCFPLHKWL